MGSAFAISIGVLAALALCPHAAFAHFGPAEPPDFGAPQCILVVDKQTTPEIVLPYELGYDDTGPEIGHIFLPDSKTHQFYAFRGSVVAALPRYEYRPFVAGPPALLPLWIDSSDVERAQAAFDPSNVPDFHPETIGSDLLHAREDIAGEWLEVSTAPARVPITLAQSAQGVRWDLTAVPAGVYQLVSYTFSPPYNAWEPRVGVVKVVDGGNAPPAITLDSIDAILYAGQGQRVTGCVDAPAGSTLSAWYRLDGEGETETSWHPWQTNAPVASGKLDLCFASPDAQQSGMVRMRVSVRSPDGRETFAYSPDALVLVGMPESCSPSATQCCEPLQPTAAARATQPQVDAGVSTAGQPPPGQLTSGQTAAGPTTASPTATAAQGCTAASGHEPASASLFSCLIGSLLLVRVRARRRKPYTR